MFYMESKENALEVHKRAVENYDATYEELRNELASLYRRRKISVRLLLDVEDLVNSIANNPKKYEIIIKKIQAKRETYHQTEEYGKEAYETALKSGVGIVSGLTGAAAVAGVAPSMAMWVATTFGTASTGTAISTLSGVVAEKAALAWLGGGALSVGGTGVAGGEALLALAGPIGWVIAGGSIVTSVSAMSLKNKKVANKAIEEAKQIELKTHQLCESVEKIDALSNETIKLYSHLQTLRKSLLSCYGKNFKDIEDDDQKKLGSMVNDALSLSELINKTV